MRYQHTRDQELVKEYSLQAEPPYVRARLSRSTSRTPPKLRNLGSPRTPGSSTRQQLQQALADKAVLVAQLHRMVSEVAHARADAKQNADSSERSLAAALRLGELGQAGMALVNEMSTPGSAAAFETESRRRTIG